MGFGKVRGLVYKMGFRPKLGSIFHSPSLHLIYGFKGAFEVAAKEFSWVHATFDNPTFSARVTEDTQIIRIVHHDKEEE